MAQTKQITVTVSPTLLAITVQTVCKTVTLSELQSNANWPTTDFQIQSPLATSDIEYRIKGLSKVFTAQGKSYFLPGTVLGYISVPAGGSNTTFVQYEE